MPLSRASLDLELLGKVNFKSSGVAKSLSFLCLLFLFFSCASGGSSQPSPEVTQQSVVTETDKRIPFESFTNVMTSTWGDVSNDFAGINLYKGPYFLKLTSNSIFGEEALIGFQFNF